MTWGAVYEIKTKIKITEPFCSFETSVYGKSIDLWEQSFKEYLYGKRCVFYVIQKKIIILMKGLEINEYK